MVDTGTFQVTLRQAKPFQILYNGEETEIIVPVIRGTLDLNTGTLTVEEVSEE